MRRVTAGNLTGVGLNTCNCFWPCLVSSPTATAHDVKLWTVPCLWQPIKVHQLWVKQTFTYIHNTPHRAPIFRDISLVDLVSIRFSKTMILSKLWIVKTEEVQCWDFLYHFSGKNKTILLFKNNKLALFFSQTTLVALRLTLSHAHSMSQHLSVLTNDYLSSACLLFSCEHGLNQSVA